MMHLACHLIGNVPQLEDKGGKNMLLFFFYNHFDIWNFASGASGALYWANLWRAKTLCCLTCEEGEKGKGKQEKIRWEVVKLSFGDWQACQLCCHFVFFRSISEVISLRFFLAEDRNRRTGCSSYSCWAKLVLLILCAGYINIIN